MTKRQTKELLLGTGAEILHRKGFSDTGIQEVLKSAGVPKGSFYYHFKSKEDFGLQVMEVYAGVMFQTLQTNTSSGEGFVLEALQGFFRDMTDYAVMHKFAGCPLGNLAQELGDTNELFGSKLNDIFARLEDEIADRLSKAIAAGEINRKIDVKQFALFLVSSWEGALLRMKLTKNTEPFDVFMKTAFNDLISGE